MQFFHVLGHLFNVFSFFGFFLVFCFVIFIYLFILFMAVLGLRFCARAFSSCGKRGPLFIVVCGRLTVAAPLVAEQIGRASCRERV